MVNWLSTAILLGVLSGLVLGQGKPKINVHLKYIKQKCSRSVD